MTGRLAILYHESSHRIDAIRQYSQCLVAALSNRRVPAVLILRTKTGSWAVNDTNGPPASTRYVRHLEDELTSSDTVVLQYNPFSFGPRGFAPWLPIALWKLRHAGSPPAIAIMVHEPYVPMTNWRWALIGASQRVQLKALRASADLFFASIERWTHELGRLFQGTPCCCLPVGSLLPDMRRSREDERNRIGISAEGVAIAALGGGHPSRLDDYVVASVNAVARAGHQTWLLNLGMGPLRTSQLDRRVRVHTPGPLSDRALAQQLAAADLFLAPFVDGVSTRRTTLMAALQHGLAVIGTDGALTDWVLRDATQALRLAPVGRPDLFSSATQSLAESTSERTTLRVEARALYERCFDWPVLTERLMAGLKLAGKERISIRSVSA